MCFLLGHISGKCDWRCETMEAFPFWKLLKTSRCCFFGGNHQHLGYMCVHTCMCARLRCPAPPSSVFSYMHLLCKHGLPEGCSHLFILWTGFSHLVLLWVFLFKGWVQSMLAQGRQLPLCFSGAWQWLDFTNLVPDWVSFYSPQRSVQIIICCVKELWVIQCFGS